MLDDDEIAQAFTGLVEDVALAKRRCRFDVPADPYNLLPYERLAVWIWSLSTHPVGAINRALREGFELTDHEFVYAAVLRAAIAKIPAAGCPWCFRGLAIPTDDFDIPSYFAHGTEHVWKAFSSATIDLPRAYVGNLLLLIQPISARPIMMYAEDPFEYDVLFAPGSRFVSAGGWSLGARYVVVLRETS